MENQPINKITLIKNIYFYLVSFVALMMVVFSAANLINIALKQWVFTKADENYYYSGECAMDKVAKATIETGTSTAVAPSPEDCAKSEERQREMDRKSRESQRQRDAVQDISFLLIGIPLFAIHWFYARKKD